MAVEAIEGTDKTHGRYVVTEWDYRGDIESNYMVVQDQWKLIIPYSKQSSVINALYDLNLERASSQIDTIMQQARLEVLAEIEFRIADGVMERSAYNQRRLLALKPAGEAGA